MKTFGYTETTDAGKVVTMDRFRNGRGSGVGLSPLRQAEAYWSALRDGAGIPKRSQIDPRGLENLLEYAFIVERVAPGIARFRLAGQHLVQLSGMEVRGMPMTALFTPASRATIGAALEQVFDAPAVAELCLASEPRHGRAPIEARMLLLPLKSDMGDISRALGVIVSDCREGGAPNRFDVTSASFRPVSGLRFDAGPDTGLLPSAEPVDPFEVQGPVSLPGFSDSAPQPTLRGRPPHLRLVKSD